MWVTSSPLYKQLHQTVHRTRWAADPTIWAKNPNCVKSQADLSLDNQLLHTKCTCGFILFIWSKIPWKVQHPLLGLSEAEWRVVIEGELGVDWEALTPVFSTLRRAQRTDPLIAIFGGSGWRLLPWDTPVIGGQSPPSSGRLSSVTSCHESCLAVPQVWFPRELPQGVGLRERA